MVTYEHTSYLSDYFRKELACIDFAEDQSVLKLLVKVMIAAMSVLITKFQHVSASHTSHHNPSRTSSKQRQKQYNLRQ